MKTYSIPKGFYFPDNPWEDAIPVHETLIDMHVCYACKALCIDYDGSFVSGNTFRCSACQKSRYMNDPEIRDKMRQQAREWAKNNKEKKKDYFQEYYHERWGKEIVRAHAGKRRAREKDAIPFFAENNALENKRLSDIYSLSRLLSAATGIEHHVDHMWPLADGGPHWSGNLQIITAKENLSKSASVCTQIKSTIQDMLREQEELYATGE